MSDPRSSGAADDGNAQVDNAPIEELSLGCKHGDARACTKAAEAFQWGNRGVKKDWAQSTFFVRRACELGDWNGCSLFASSLAGGLGIAKDLKEAFRLALRACDEGQEAFACVNAAEWLVEQPRLLGHHEPQAFDLALRGRSETYAVAALSAWMVECGSDASKLDYKRIGRALTECAQLLDQSAARLRTMDLDAGTARENVDEELKSVCGEFHDALPEHLETPFEWPKTCSNLGIDAPPPPPPAEPQPTGPSDWNPGH